MSFGARPVEKQVSNEELVRAWFEGIEHRTGVRKVAETLGIEYSVLNQRVGTLRRLGVKLPHMPKKGIPHTVTTAELAELNQVISSQASGPVTDDSPRLFYVVESPASEKELFETREQASAYATREFEELDDKPYTITISEVRHTYQESNGRWNYDDLADTFTSIITVTSRTPKR